MYDNAIDDLLMADQLMKQREEKGRRT